MIKTCVTCGRRGSVVDTKGRCYECAQKAKHDKITDEIKAGKNDSTWCEDEIFCPWCGSDDCSEAKWRGVCTENGGKDENKG